MGGWVDGFVWVCLPKQMPSKKRSQAEAPVVESSGSESEGRKASSGSEGASAWVSRHPSSASLRAACRVHRGVASASADLSTEDAASREQTVREKRQRRAAALETLWHRLKVAL